jgi:DNA repair protein RecN (Recombination protein N)
LEEEQKEHERSLLRAACALTRARKEAATKLSPDIEEELATLGMKGTRFSVAFTPVGEGANTASLGAVRVSPRGAEEAEFFFCPNPGESLKPLSKIASGGELSRLILALKRIMSRGDEMGTLVFDEVDTGIGGATAEVLGKKIKETSERHQVLCITHLPQIACFADTHYRITKRIEKGRARTTVDQLSGDARVDEVARMLAGARVTTKAKAHALEMIKNTHRR